MKGTMVSFVPTFFGCFLGNSIPIMSFYFFKCFFLTCFSCFWWGGDIELLIPDKVIGSNDS